METRTGTELETMPFAAPAFWMSFGPAFGLRTNTSRVSWKMASSRWRFSSLLTPFFGPCARRREQRARECGERVIERVAGRGREARGGERGVQRGRQVRPTIGAKEGEFHFTERMARALAGYGRLPAPQRMARQDVALTTPDTPPLTVSHWCHAFPACLPVPL